MSDQVDNLKKEYDRLAAAVNETAPNTPERWKAMEAKKEAFLKFKAADDAKVNAEAVSTEAERKHDAAEAAAKDAAAAKKAAEDAARASRRNTAVGRNDPGQQPQDTAPKVKP